MMREISKRLLYTLINTEYYKLLIEKQIVLFYIDMCEEND